jgi:hypothetical protein
VGSVCVGGGQHYFTRAKPANIWPHSYKLKSNVRKAQSLQCGKVALKS